MLYKFLVTLALVVTVYFTNGKEMVINEGVRFSAHVRNAAIINIYDVKNKVIMSINMNQLSHIKIGKKEGH